MSSSEIKVNALVVRGHTRKLKAGNKVVRGKASACRARAGKTNYSAYIKGIECSNRLAAIMAVLANNIDEDCANVNIAADIINGMDEMLSKQLNKKGIYTYK